jgi:hypothetical protein
VLFLDKPPAATPVAQASQCEEKLRVRVFDPAQRRRLLKVSFATGEAKLAGQPTLRGDGTCSYGVDVPYANQAALTRRLHGDVTLTEGKLALRTRALVAPRFEDPDFERPQFDTAQFHSGQRSQRLDPGGLVHYPLELVPGRKYRISLWILRQEQVGSVQGNIHLHLSNTHHHFGWNAKAGEWTRVETEYELKGQEQPHLYLYNWQGATKPAWFDGVVVEEITR